MSIKKRLENAQFQTPFYIVILLTYSFLDFSTFALGFHTLTPIKPPMPDTTAITAKVKIYDRNILKNSIKFATTIPLFRKSHFQKQLPHFCKFTENSIYL